MELYIQKEKIFDSGTASSGKEDYIIDSTKSWTTDQWVNYFIYILSGTGAGLISKITSNDATTLNFETVSIDLDSTSVYQIVSFPYYRVEMFQDEKVSVTSTIQNYSDIGKLFTDYSQSFTIPASPHNNAIFSHWYDNAVDNGYDARIRYNAYIEVETIPFREGNVQLEKANKKNGYIESYTLTFYGNLTQLKDKFGEDKLNTLDFSSLNHVLSSSDVITRIRLGTDVCYPLIGNNTRFEYLTASGFDVTTTSGAIKWDDLFPAVRINKILDFIETKYGITFTGNFLNYGQFDKLYMYMKNMELPRAYGNEVILDGVAVTSDNSGPVFPEANLSTNIVTMDWFNSSWQVCWSNISSTEYLNPNRNRRLIMKILIYPQNTGVSNSMNVNYQIKVYRDGVLYKTFDNLIGDNNVEFYNETMFNDPDTHSYYATVASAGFFQFSGVFYVFRDGSTNKDSRMLNAANISLRNGQNISAIQNIGAYVPDIKVADFFMGLVKMFNLIITPINATTFKLEPLELYYQAGQIKDLTPYIYANELDIEKPKLFKSIDFSYEKSENILNNTFSGMFNREYGDLVYNSVSNSESGKYEIKLPFEDVMWEKTTGYDFITATLWNKDLQTYTPKPILMYKNELITLPTGIKITNPTGFNTITDYIRFNNDISLGGTDLGYVHTLNWGAEVSSWYLNIAPNGLYKRHYEQYITNLYNQKTRVLKVKAKLPYKLLGQGIANNPNELVNLKLNDRIIIRDNRYIINSFTTDLTNGEATFELINDYRDLDYNSVGYRYSNIDWLNVDNTEQEVQIDLYKGMFKEFEIKPIASFITSPTYGIKYEDTSIIVSIAANTSGIERTEDISVNFLDYNDNIIEFQIFIKQQP